MYIFAVVLGFFIHELGTHPKEVAASFKTPIPVAERYDWDHEPSWFTVAYTPPDSKYVYKTNQPYPPFE